MKWGRNQLRPWLTDEANDLNGEIGQAERIHVHCRPKPGLNHWLMSGMLPECKIRPVHCACSGKLSSASTPCSTSCRKSAGQTAQAAR